MANLLKRAVLAFGAPKYIITDRDAFRLCHACLIRYARHPRSGPAPVRTPLAFMIPDARASGLGLDRPIARSAFSVGSDGSTSSKQ